MYVSAAVDDAPPAPLWRLSGGVTFFAGTLDRNALHEHGAPVYLAGLAGPFGLKIGDGRWRSCRTALVPAGTPHELDLGGDPVAVLYAEPSLGAAPALARLVADAEEEGGALIGRDGEIALFRALWEDRGALSWADEALADVVGFAGARAGRPLDARVARAAGLLEEAEPDALVSVAAAAGVSNLSVSRLQHLFLAETGVSFRRYRSWIRMRRAIGEIVAGATFTQAAHAAGYADQPHFAHDFRRTFGAPASRSLSGVRR